MNKQPIGSNFDLNSFLENLGNLIHLDQSFDELNNLVTSLNTCQNLKDFRKLFDKITKVFKSIDYDEFSTTLELAENITPQLKTQLIKYYNNFNDDQQRELLKSKYEKFFLALDKVETFQKTVKSLANSPLIAESIKAKLRNIFNGLSDYEYATNQYIFTTQHDVNLENFYEIFPVQLFKIDDIDTRTLTLAEFMDKMGNRIVNIFQYPPEDSHKQFHPHYNPILDRKNSDHPDSEHFEAAGIHIGRTIPINNRTLLPTTIYSIFYNDIPIGINIFYFFGKLSSKLFNFKDEIPTNHSELIGNDKANFDNFSPVKIVVVFDHGVTDTLEHDLSGLAWKKEKIEEPLVCKKSRIVLEVKFSINRGEILLKSIAFVTAMPVLE